MVRRPTRAQLEAAAEMLWRLASLRGLSNLRLGQDPDELVADIEPGHTYFDVVAFEQDVEGRLGWRPAVVLSGAPGARAGPKLAKRSSAA
jgi:hypothetical protein